MLGFELKIDALNILRATRNNLCELRVKHVLTSVDLRARMAEAFESLGELHSESEEALELALDMVDSYFDFQWTTKEEDTVDSWHVLLLCVITLESDYCKGTMYKLLSGESLPYKDIRYMLPYDYNR